jgi:hypothetical protein
VVRSGPLYDRFGDTALVRQDVVTFSIGIRSPGYHGRKPGPLIFWQELQNALPLRCCTASSAPHLFRDATTLTNDFMLDRDEDFPFDPFEIYKVPRLQRARLMPADISPLPTRSSRYMMAAALGVSGLTRSMTPLTLANRFVQQ